MVEIPTQALQTVGHVFTVGTSGKQVWDAHMSAADGLNALNQYASDLGMTVGELFAYSSSANVAYAQLANQTGREATKAGLGIATNFLPGGMVTGIIGGEAANRSVDAVAGYDPHLEEVMQGVGAAYAKIQSGQALDRNDAGLLLKGHLNQEESAQLRHVVDNAGADPNNLAAVYDTLPTVMRKAELLIGRPLEVGESATQIIADTLAQGHLSPAIFLINEPDLPTVISTAANFQLSSASQAGGAVTPDPLQAMGYDGQWQGDAATTPPNVPARPLAGSRQKS